MNQVTVEMLFGDGDKAVSWAMGDYKHGNGEIETLGRCRIESLADSFEVNEKVPEGAKKGDIAVDFFFKTSKSVQVLIGSLQRLKEKLMQFEDGKKEIDELFENMKNNSSQEEFNQSLKKLEEEIFGSLGVSEEELYGKNQSGLSAKDQNNETKFKIGDLAYSDLEEGVFRIKPWGGLLEHPEDKYLAVFKDMLIDMRDGHFIFAEYKAPLNHLPSL